MTNLQKANVGKRIIAAVFDGIMLSIVAVAFATLFSYVFGYDTYMKTVDDAYATYESTYGVKFEISQQEYEALNQTQRENYDTAYQALSKDEAVVYAYNMLINLTMVILTLSVLLGVVLVEFVVPLLFGNGRTLGKAIFGIAVMHVEGIRINNLQLFTRTVLGKFALELMIPLSVVMMIFFNAVGIFGLGVLLVLVVAQIICLVSTRNFSLLHDEMAGTVVVDFASQRIFDTREQLLEYKKTLHAASVAQTE